MICIAYIFSVCSFCCNFASDSFCYIEFFLCSTDISSFSLPFKVMSRLPGLYCPCPYLQPQLLLLPLSRPLLAWAVLCHPAHALLPACLEFLSWPKIPRKTTCRTKLLFWDLVRWSPRMELIAGGAVEGVPSCYRVKYAVQWGSLYRPVSGTSAQVPWEQGTKSQLLSHWE